MSANDMKAVHELVIFFSYSAFLMKYAPRLNTIRQVSYLDIIQLP